MAADAMAYVPYAHYGSDGYGLAWHTPPFIEATLASPAAPPMASVAYQPAAWCGAHDFWAFRRLPTS